MSVFDPFKEKYPRRKAVINGCDFNYRYYRNENSDITVVLLVGGIGLSDLLLLHFEEFAKSYSVLSFDYEIAYATNRQLVDAIAELLKSLGVKAFLVGQSLGGFIAQILARQHPEVVEGLALSNTGTLSVDLDESATKCLTDMVKAVDKSLFLIKAMPFWLVKKLIRRGVMTKMGGQLFGQELEIMSEFCGEMEKTLTKEYEIHMTLLLKDLQNHWNMQRSDFERFEGKVLLILSDDDSTFNDSVKQALIDLMPSPRVITDIRGGHMALLLKLDKYIAAVKSFIDNIEG